jgi:hypothetical protein
MFRQPHGLLLMTSGLLRPTDVATKSMPVKKPVHRGRMFANGHVARLDLMASASSRLEFGVVCHWLSEPFKGFNCQKSPWRAEPVQDSTDGMARCGTLNSKLDKTLVSSSVPLLKQITLSRFDGTPSGVRIQPANLTENLIVR